MDTLLIDDFSGTDLISALGTHWRAVTDQVMGGVSQATIARTEIDGRRCLCLTGDVSLENNGGFVQAALDLSRSSEPLDASGFTGLRLLARGNGEPYSVHLRTPANVRPWQSYRSHFVAGPSWTRIDLPFAGFSPHRLETPLDVSRLVRVGLVAIGREFRAELAVSEIRLFR